MFRAAVSVGLAFVTLAAVYAQSGRGVDNDRVRAAREYVRGNEAATLDEQVRLCEVPAPPFGERARARVVRDLLSGAGLTSARFDSVGNVLAERRGRSARPHVVMSAHLDTVFPEGTPVKVTRQGAVLRGPGIGDNCRGLAVLVTLARALREAAVRTDGSITFVATVGEEGLGDLRGARGLFATTLRGSVDYFVGIDGSGFSIAHVGVGSRRYRVTFRGPGGHAFLDFGRPNPAQALGRPLALLSYLECPSTPRTTFKVGRIGGGTAINAIPSESWMEIDLRSSDAAALDRLDRRVRDAVDRGAALASGKGRDRISVSIERLGERPAGRTPEQSRIVQAALAASSEVGVEATLIENSTDANAAMPLNIPAISIGGGGTGANTHSLAESFDSTGSVRGTERALLLVLALSRGQ